MENVNKKKNVNNKCTWNLIHVCRRLFDFFFIICRLMLFISVDADDVANWKGKRCSVV